MKKTEKALKGTGEKGKKEDPLDILDSINSEIGFLTEIVMLINNAHRYSNMPADISLTHVSSDMLERLVHLKELSGRLFEHSKGKEEAL